MDRPVGMHREAGSTLAGSAPAGHTVIRELGRGRSGRAVLCREDASDRQVVIKVLDVRPRDERSRQALESELQAAAAASRHGFAVPVEAVWSEPGVGMCLRQRFCPGGSAQAALDSGGPFRPDDVVVLGIRAVLALAHSHRRGVLHLDIRPANLFTDAAGQCALADGGVTRAVNRADPATGVLFDPRYAARELFGWEEPGPPADVYALGATLAALLVGEPPNAEAARRGEAALYTSVCSGELTPPQQGMPPVLGSLIARMTAADPSARPPLTEVDRILRQQAGPTLATRVPAREPAPADDRVALPAPHIGVAAAPATAAVDERRRRTRLLVAGGAVGVLFVGSAIAVMASSGGDGPPSVSPAEAAAVVNGASLPPLASQDLAEFSMPDLVFQRTESGSEYYVTWEPPRSKRVSGFLVVAVSKATDAVQARQFIEPGKNRAGFTAPPVHEDSCFKVSPLVYQGPTLQIAERERECLVVPGSQAPAADTGVQRPA
jgi:hypothetical protein